MAKCHESLHKNFFKISPFANKLYIDCSSLKSRYEVFEIDAEVFGCLHWHMCLYKEISHRSLNMTWFYHICQDHNSDEQ